MLNIGLQKVFDGFYVCDKVSRCRKNMDQATTRVEEVIMAILHDRTKKELYGEANSLAVVVEAYNVLKPERLFAISLIT